MADNDLHSWATSYAQPAFSGYSGGADVEKPSQAFMSPDDPEWEQFSGIMEVSKKIDYAPGSRESGNVEDRRSTPVGPTSRASFFSGQRLIGDIGVTQEEGGLSATAADIGERPSTQPADTGWKAVLEQFNQEDASGDKQEENRVSMFAKAPLVTEDDKLVAKTKEQTAKDQTSVKPGDSSNPDDPYVVQENRQGLLFKETQSGKVSFEGELPTFVKESWADIKDFMSTGSPEASARLAGRLAAIGMGRTIARGNKPGENVLSSSGERPPKALDLEEVASYNVGRLDKFMLENMTPSVDQTWGPAINTFRQGLETAVREDLKVIPGGKELRETLTTELKVAQDSFAKSKQKKLDDPEITSLKGLYANTLRDALSWQKSVEDVALNARRRGVEPTQLETLIKGAEFQVEQAAKIKAELQSLESRSGDVGAAKNNQHSYPKEGEQGFQGDIDPAVKKALKNFTPMEERVARDTMRQIRDTPEHIARDASTPVLENITPRIREVVTTLRQQGHSAADIADILTRYHLPEGVGISRNSVERIFFGKTNTRREPET